MEGEFCQSCGVPQDAVTTEKLWDIYHRIRDGRSQYEALVFTSDWLQENVTDDEDVRAMDHAMDKDMRNRGLCGSCGRPDLSGISPDDVMSHEEAKDYQEMWAEQAAERRMGC